MYKHMIRLLAEEKEEEEEEEYIEGMRRRLRLGDDMKSYPSKKNMIYKENKDLVRDRGYKKLAMKQEKTRDDAKKMKGVEFNCYQEDIPEYDQYLYNHRRKRGESSSFSCDMCADVMSISDQVCVSKCVHEFCKDCLQSYLKKKIQEDVRHVECPDSKCKAALTPEVCSDLIPEEVFDAWESAVNEMKALEDMTKIECPYVDCNGEFTDDAKGYKIRACPTCVRLMCVDCGAKWHHGMDCETFRKSFFFRYSARLRSSNYGRRRHHFYPSDYSSTDCKIEGKME